MKLIIRSVTLGAALLAGAGSASGASGVLIVEKSTGAGAAPATNQIQIESNRMRAESTGASGDKQVVVFDGARQVLMMIDNQKKTYTEIDKADADRLGAQVSDAMAQIEKQMAGMPPAQRAQIEAMMKGRGGAIGAAAPKVQYRKAGTATVGKWTCDKYDGYEGETKTSEVCTVDPKVLGFTTADLAISQQLAEFFKKIVPQMSAQMFTIGNAEQQGFSGVPVRRMYTVGGRQVTSEITEVSRQDFPDASYAVPAGYARQQFGPAGRGGR